MLWQDTQQSITDAARSSAPDMPAGFDEAFSAAWGQGRLATQSISHGNAQAAALSGYLDEVRQKTGQDIGKQVYARSDMVPAASEAVAKLKATNPDLDIPDLTDDELDRRALSLSRNADRNAADIAGREKTFGGKVGSFLGGAASALTDPLNIVALAVAPAAELGVVATALSWGGIAGASQAAIEVANAGYREKVQPGYGESGEPAANVLGSAAGGVLMGGGVKVAGNLWTRMKTGAWPQSVRDAGNVVESEANVQQTNVLPGVAGEAAHREALGKAIDDIVAGRPVEPSPIERLFSNVDDMLGVRTEATAATEAAKAERAASTELPDSIIKENLTKWTTGYGGETDTSLLPEAVRRFGESLKEETRFYRGDSQHRPPLGDESGTTSVSDLAGGFSFSMAKNEGLLEEMSAGEGGKLPVNEIIVPAGTKVLDVGPHAGPNAGEQERMLPPGKFVKVGERTEQFDFGKDGKKLDRQITTYRFQPKTRAAQAEFPFTAAAGEAKAELHAGTIADGIGGMARMTGYDMPKEEAAELAQRVVASKSDDEAREILQAVADRPQTLAETVPSVAEVARQRREDAKAAPEVPTQTADQMRETLAAPDHQEAIRADIDRARAMGDVKMPGTDERGNHTMVSVDKAMDEVDAYKAAAEQIQACARPMPDESEAA